MRTLSTTALLLLVAGFGYAGGHGGGFASHGAGYGHYGGGYGHHGGGFASHGGGYYGHYGGGYGHPWGGHSYPLHYPAYYGHGFYGSFYSHYASPYSGYSSFLHPYYWWYPTYTNAGYYEPLVGIRCEVTPQDASVFVDGYYAGRVDDYDGYFQRLRVTQGPHTLTFRRPAFVPYTIDVQATGGQAIHIRHELSPGEDRLPDDPRQQEERRGYLPPTGGGIATGDPPASIAHSDMHSGEPAPSEAQREAQAMRSRGLGTLRLNIYTVGSVVYIDREFWGILREEGSAEVRLAAGIHRIDALKPGHRTASQNVRIEADARTELDLRLIGE